jgi:hypothetical protein
MISTIIVDPNQSGIGYPGIETRYDLYVMKFGPGTDTVDLSIRHNYSWPVSLFDSSGTDTLTDHNLNGVPDVIAVPNDSVPIILGIIPPGSAPAGITDTLFLIGVSDIIPGERDSARVLTTIQNTGALSIYPDQSGNGTPGTWLSFPLTCRNTQNRSDTVDLRFRDQMGYIYQWRDSLNNPLTDHNANGLPDLPGITGNGGEADFRLQVYVPPGAPNGTVDSITATGFSGRDSLIRDSANIKLNVGLYVQIRIDPDCRDSTSAGDSINYLLIVQNLGNTSDVIDLQTIGGSFNYTLRDRNGLLLTDTDSDGMVDVGLLPPYVGTESILVRVIIPTAPPSTVDSIFIRAQSSLNTSIYDQALLITSIQGGIWALIIDPDQDNRVAVGQSVTYRLQATLAANMPDAVELSFTPVATGWTVSLLDSSGTPLTDSDVDGFVELPGVVPSIPRSFDVRVAAPDHFDFSGLTDSMPSYNLILRGHSHRQTGISDTALIRTFLVPPFEVHNYRNPFHDQTRFFISLPKDGQVTIEIYNRAGEMVRSLITSQWFSYGIHFIPWDGKNDQGKELAPSAYIYVVDFTANDGERITIKKKAVIAR